MISNSLKLLVVQNRRKKGLNLQRVNQIINQVRVKEIEKLKNPNKGQLFVHLDQKSQYSFFQFNGNQWIEIK